MYTNFIKALKDETIFPIELAEDAIRVGENMIDIDIPTADTQVISQVVDSIDKWLGNKNQNIYVERFGDECTTIAIENPILRDKQDGTVIDLMDRDRTGYANFIQEINCHELPRDTMLLSEINPKIQTES